LDVEGKKHFTQEGEEGGFLRKAEHPLKVLGMQKPQPTQKILYKKTQGSAI